MGKFTQAASQGPAQIEDLQRKAGVSLPTGPQTEAAPQPAPDLQQLFAQKGGQEVAPSPLPEELQVDASEVTQEEMAVEAERQRVPNLIERGTGWRTGS